MSDTTRDLLDRAIEMFGSQRKLADACGVTQQSIFAAKRAGKCSAAMAVQIEAATKGAVTARDLIPDLPWPGSSGSIQADAS